MTGFVVMFLIVRPSRHVCCALNCHDVLHALGTKKNGDSQGRRVSFRNWLSNEMLARKNVRVKTRNVHGYVILT